MVASTCLPKATEKVFRDMVQPYISSGQLRIVSGYYPSAAELDGQTLTALSFEPVSPEKPALRVRARVTIDASDWGEAIKAAGAEYEFGPDLRSKYGEPRRRPIAPCIRSLT